MDDISAVDDGIRGIVARNWPHLLSRKIDRGAASQQQSSPEQPVKRGAPELIRPEAAGEGVTI
jgi:hypothetical protein